MGTSSVTMKLAEDWAKKYDKKLLATDPRFARAVTVIHEEGTVFHFQSAFAVKYTVGRSEEKTGYYCVFAEHQDIQVFSEDEVHIYQYSGWAEIEEF